MLIKCLRNWQQAEKKGRLEGFTLTSYEEVSGEDILFRLPFIRHQVNWFFTRFLIKLSLTQIIYRSPNQSKIHQNAMIYHQMVHCVQNKIINLFIVFWIFFKPPKKNSWWHLIRLGWLFFKFNLVMIKLFCCLHFLVIVHWKVMIFDLIWLWINFKPSLY